MTRNGLDNSSDRKYHGLGKCEKLECIIWVNVIDFAVSHGFGPKLVHEPHSPNEVLKIDPV